MKRALGPMQQVPRGDQRQAHIRLLTEREAAEHCRYFDRGCADPVRAFRQVALRLGIPVKRIGRARLYDPRVLDAFLDEERWTERHRPTHPSERRAALALVQRKSSSEGFRKGGAR